jgi:GDP-L-fucose synthase
MEVRNGREEIRQIASAPTRSSRASVREDDLWAAIPADNAPYGIAKKMMVMGRRTGRYGFNVITCPRQPVRPRDHFFEPEKCTSSALIRSSSTPANPACRVVVWGSGFYQGTPVSREFLYVDDAAEGIALAAERYDEPAPVNIGAGQEVPIHDLIAMIRDMTGYRGRIVRDLSRPDGQPRRSLDTSRAREKFGFVARTPFEEGLRRTIAWYEQARRERS